LKIRAIGVLILGYPTKAKEELGWVPEFDLQGLVKDMMQGDVQLLKKRC
jgi:GDPmannose 4,6-dehydratase